MIAADFLRRLDKPHIRIISDEYCPNCKFILNQGHPKYYFVFDNWTEWGTTFHGICEAARNRIAARKERLGL